MKALVLDFDGVISDSAREAFEVALRTYGDLSPESTLAQRDREALYEGFLEAMPLGNRAEDFGTVLAALEQGRPLPDQAAYDAFRAERGTDWLERYHRHFYEVRGSMFETDPVGWRGLMRPYRPFLDTLRRCAGTVPYAIATAKDRRSVDALLADYGVADLFAPELIEDKEAGPDKSRHLELLAGTLELPFPEMTFVDDKVNHLDAVAKLGVRGALAGWGYNGPREHRLARERGYLLLSFDNSDELLFG